MNTITVGTSITSILAPSPGLDREVLLQNQSVNVIYIQFDGLSGGGTLSTSNGYQLAAGATAVLTGQITRPGISAIAAGTSALHVQQVFENPNE
jgi:hypothetical protein